MREESRLYMKRTKGFTLIELMISMFIMTIVLLGCFYILTAAHNMSEDSRSRLLALNAARSTLEAIKTTALINVPAVNTAAYVPADLPNGAIAITTNPANLAGQTVATVTVTVSWLGPRNMNRSLQISTMRSQY